MLPMKKLLTTAFCTFSLISCAAAATSDSNTKTPDKKIEKNVNVFINKQDNKKESVEIKINNDVYQFEMPELMDNETRSISTKDGKAVTLTRKGASVTAKMGGEEIQLPNPAGEMSAKFMTLGEDDSNAIVISGKNLTEDQRKKVAQAIKASGVDAPVKFVETKTKIIKFNNADMNWVGDHSEKRKVIIHSDSAEILELEGEENMDVVIEKISPDGEHEVKVIKKVEKK